jgi:prevent-host-death family protein
MAQRTVTSADFQKSFGRYREQALREPVVITNHGRESLVLLAAEEYHRLKRLDRRSLFAWELDNDTLRAIEEADIPAEASAFDHELDS